MFKNLTVFSYPESCELDIEYRLDAEIAHNILKPVGPMEMSSIGFAAEALGYIDGARVSTVKDFMVLTIARSEKILPAAIVNAELQKRLDAIERAEGRKPGGKTRKRIKEDVVLDLLPRAFVKTTYTHAFFDTNRRRLIVDTPSPGKAEDVVSLIRHALGSFPALPLAPQEPPASAMTEWIARYELAEGLSFGSEIVLVDHDKKTWSGRNTEVSTEEVTEHLNAGMHVKQLGLQFNERVSFVLDENLTIRKFKLLDVVMERLDEMEEADRAAILDAHFLLIAEESRALIDFLCGEFKVAQS